MYLTHFYFYFQKITTHPTTAWLGRHHPEKLIFVVGDGDEGIELHSRPDFFGSPVEDRVRPSAFSSILNFLGTLCWLNFNFGLNFMGEEGEQRIVFVCYCFFRLNLYVGYCFSSPRNENSLQTLTVKENPLRIHSRLRGSHWQFMDFSM
jgi:hypothetical protein